MIGVPTMLNEISWLEGEVSLYMWKYFLIIIIVIIIVIIVIVISHAVIYRMSSHPGAYFKVLQRFSKFLKMFFYI